MAASGKEFAIVIKRADMKGDMVVPPSFLFSCLEREVDHWSLRAWSHKLG